MPSTPARGRAQAPWRPGKACSVDRTQRHSGAAPGPDRRPRPAGRLPGPRYVIIRECVPAPVDRGRAHDPRVMIGNRVGVLMGQIPGIGLTSIGKRALRPKRGGQAGRIASVSPFVPACGPELPGASAPGTLRVPGPAAPGPGELGEV